MSMEDAPKTSLQGRVNWEGASILITSAWRNGKLEKQQENLILDSIMVPAPPQAKISIFMADMMDQDIKIPSTSWTLVHWSGPSYPVAP